jgi:hypothetical protein
MARFPSRENDVAVLAEDLIAGLSEHTEHFPSPPVATEVMQSSYQAYKEARDAAVRAEGMARDAFDVKDDALEELTEHMKANLKYAEFAVNGEEGKLNLLGWGPRRSAKRLEPPARPRDLEVARSGKGWVFLDWKPPLEGGDVAAYKVQVAHPEDGVWKDVGMSIETQLMLNDQERGVDLQYHVIAVNRVGQGGASNIVRVVL